MSVWETPISELFARFMASGQQVTLGQATRVVVIGVVVFLVVVGVVQMVSEMGRPKPGK